MTLVEVKFLEPNADLIRLIADDMRQADADEVWSSNHFTPLEALTAGWTKSHVSVVITVDDEPCVMLGLVIHDILTERKSVV